jgi:hypothetical protein
MANHPDQKIDVHITLARFGFLHVRADGRALINHARMWGNAGKLSAWCDTLLSKPTNVRRIGVNGDCEDWLFGSFTSVWTLNFRRGIALGYRQMSPASSNKSNVPVLKPPLMLTARVLYVQFEGSKHERSEGDKPSVEPS